ncbi:uncharacterized protein BDZ99DRAFT_462031, partial [Mytilinidion resinicola]
MTLNEVIRDTAGNLERITLNHRFALASALATTLLDFHKASLVHKSISSHNIIFFSRHGPCIDDPYLIGFNYSRPNQPKAFTTGPPPSLTARKYYHPSYTSEASRRGERFRLDYDYYGLGLVLVEIGLWDRLENFKGNSPTELKNRLLKTQVPLLGHTVGQSYRKAVEACLMGPFG